MITPLEKYVDKLRKIYTKGTKIKLTYMDDPQAPPAGTIGIVTYVDDMGMVHVHWDTGSSLSLDVEEDLFEII